MPSYSHVFRLTAEHDANSQNQSFHFPLAAPLCGIIKAHDTFSNWASLLALSLSNFSNVDPTFSQGRTPLQRRPIPVYNDTWWNFSRTDSELPSHTLHVTSPRTISSRTAVFAVFYCRMAWSMLVRWNMHRVKTRFALLPPECFTVSFRAIRTIVGERGGTNVCKQNARLKIFW